MELHCTKKDFRIEWFSGSGAGGQHRNKHQNCCRIIHKATGLKAQGTESRSRVKNQRAAFHRLAKLLISHMEIDDKPEISQTVIRNYHGVRNEVLDKASGLRQPYKTVVLEAHLDDMIAARAKKMAARDV